MQDLEALMGHIARVWVCDRERYPALAHMNPDERRNFLTKHSLMHISKTTGKIAALCENFDHNGKSSAGEERALKTNAVKLFVNALKLAEEAGLSANDLLTQAPQFVK